MEILANGTKVKVYDLLGEFVEGTIQGNDEAECEGNLKDLNYYVVVDGNFDNEIMMHWSEIELIKRECKIMNELKLTCIKQYASDQKQYGIDFLVGVAYPVQGITNDGYAYITSESGSDVMLTNEEIQEYFYTFSV